MTLDRSLGLIAAVFCFSALTGCVSPETSPGAWKEHDNGGRCGYESIDSEEYAFFQFGSEQAEGANPVANWRFQPGVDATQLTPEMVEGLRVKPSGEIIERYNTQFQPFVTNDCRRLFLKIGYGAKSLARERSIYKVEDLQALQSLKGQEIVLTEDGARTYSLSFGTVLEVEDVLSKASPTKKDQRLQILARTADGEAVTLTNNRRHFTASGNSDPKTLAAYEGNHEKLWQLVSSGTGPDSKPAYAAYSPSRGYPGGGALQIGLACTAQGMQLVVDTDTFINQNSRAFGMQIATDGAAPLAVPMTVLTNTNMGGQGIATQELIDQLSKGHVASVQIITWNKRKIETLVPLLGAKNAIDQALASCQ